MKIILDTADVAAIRELCEIYPVSGVTTNPSIVAREKREPFSVLKEIREVLGERDLHVETVGRDAETIVKEGEKIVKELGPNTYIKIPVTEEGIKAIRMLSAKGIPCTATAVYTLSQAYLAALSGASYVAPYVNRIDNAGGDGPGTAIAIDDAFRCTTDFDCRVVAASFKSVKQVERLIEADVYSVTVAPDILRLMLKHPGTDESVVKFENDFAALGYGETMLGK